MAQLVARLSGGQEAVSSSLATPTNKEQWLCAIVFFAFENIKKPSVLTDGFYMLF